MTSRNRPTDHVDTRDWKAEPARTGLTRAAAEAVLMEFAQALGAADLERLDRVLAPDFRLRTVTGAAAFDTNRASFLFSASQLFERGGAYRDYRISVVKPREESAARWVADCIAQWTLEDAGRTQPQTQFGSATVEQAAGPPRLAELALGPAPP